MSSQESSITTSALVVAFESVKANHGCAGVDGVTITDFGRSLIENIHHLMHEIETAEYFPLPYLQILVDKGKGNAEARKLLVPTVRDRVVQTAVLHLINPILEKEFEDCSYAYRHGRSVKQVISRIKALYDQGYRWVVNADIDAFFDTVNHELLLRKVKRYVSSQLVLNLLGQWLTADVWDGRELRPLTKGIAQGSPVSPVLANIFLDELDETMLAHDYKYIRYADDFITLCKDRVQADAALELSKEVLAELILKLDDEEVVSFDHGFKYLGVNFVRSLIFTPYFKSKSGKGVIFYPDPLDITAYIKQKRQNI